VWSRVSPEECKRILVDWLLAREIKEEKTKNFDRQVRGSLACLSHPDGMAGELHISQGFVMENFATQCQCAPCSLGFITK
jgi:hypothetical protein